MPAYQAKKKPIDPLQKRIPRNPKYANVKSTIDTGASITKYMRKIEEIRENYRYRKDEIFKRMKVTTFVQLMVQVAEINQQMLDFDSASTVGDYDEAVGNSTERTLEPEQRAESSASLAVTESDYGRSSELGTARSTMQSVISGVGELDMDASSGGSKAAAAAAAAAALSIWSDESPYLLLDVRDHDDYSKCRIIGAVNYPHTMISRAQNYEIPQMLACRNKPGRIVVLYDDDEKLAPRVATTLVERGYDNLFLLSGGLKVAFKFFPEGLITGTVPLTCRSTPAPGSAASTSRKTPAIASAQPASDGDQLDVDRLRAALDCALDGRAGSSASSVVSGATSRTAGGASSVASSRRPLSNSSTGGKPPFK